MNIFRLLNIAVELQASDIHITVDSYPIARVRGKFTKLYDKILSREDTEKMTREISGLKKFDKINECGELDFSVELKESRNRFRVNAYKQKGNYALAIRIIESNIISFETLGIPGIVKTFTNKNKGLVLVTGPTGSGKSTTLASLIDIINQNDEKHIITLEDPIEYIHHHKKSIVNQREIGNDTKSFNSALRAILRQDPDVILIGEMRDLETVSIALKAAETGHLVFSTLHTTGAAKSIDRIVDMFPHEKHQQIRTQLSTVCEGIISQQLLQTIDGGDRVVAIEVMISTPAIRNLIRENKIYQIPNMIQTGSNVGMQSMDQELVKLYKKGKISKGIALSKCADYEYTGRLIGESEVSNNIFNYIN